MTRFQPDGRWIVTVAGGSAGVDRRAANDGRANAPSSVASFSRTPADSDGMLGQDRESVDAEAANRARATAP